MCADSGCRCSIIQSISLGFKGLTENSTWLPTYCLSVQGPPPNCENITRASPGKRGEEKRDLEEWGESTTTTAVSKSQQPGEGLWVIFYGRRGTADVHLFISAVSTEVGVGTTRSVRVHFLLSGLRSLVTLKSIETSNAVS